MSLAEISVSSLSSAAPRSYTIAEVARAQTPRAQSVSDANVSLVSPQHKLSANTMFHPDGPSVIEYRQGNLDNSLSVKNQN